MAQKTKSLRPWNIRAGDRFTVRDEIAIPARVLTFEVTADPIPAWNYFSGERYWRIPRRLIATSDGRSCVYPGDESRLYRDERLTVTRESD